MMRLSLGLSSLTISILLVAHAVGMLPDREAAELHGRKILCESLAVACSFAAQKNDVQMIEALIRASVRRHPEVLSAAARGTDGHLLASEGDHWRHLEKGVGSVSTPTHMHVPIVLGDKPWGAIEVRFRPLERFPIAGPFGGSLFPLISFVGAAGTVATWLYLQSVLRKPGRGLATVVPNRVRDTLNTVMEGVLVLDKDQRIALANDAFARTIGVHPEELQGRLASDLGWVRARTGTSGGSYPWARAIAEGTPQRGAILALRTEAEAVRKVSVNSTTILGDDGACRGALATFDDLTVVESKNAQLQKLLSRLKRAQSALRKAKDQAESANRAKTDFLSSVSHEIRTPMNAILGMTEAALDTELAPVQREYIEVVKASADTLLSVINDVLDLAKIEAGKFALDPAPFALDTVVGAVLKTLSLRARQKGLSLSCDIHSEVPSRLVGDDVRLSQVLINLVGNALKFTEAGSVSVRVETEHVADEAAALHFAVSDTGTGIPANKLQAIFEPFTQADGSTTRKYGGTGLGLTICARLVAMMGGRIWVESEVGRGSVFHFVIRFGCQTSDVPADQDATPVGPADRPLNILLVDDNTFNQKVGVQKLSKMGHRIEVVGGGTEALAALERGRFDLVFMDLQMKDMDGLEATTLIREREHGTGRRTPVVAMTARAMKEDRELCLATGMDGFVSKPIRDADLLQAIRAAVAAEDRAEVETTRDDPTPTTCSPSAARVGSPGEIHESADAPSRSPIDLTRCLEFVGGNATLLDELIADFLDDCPSLVAEIEASVGEARPVALCQAAHTLKSMLLFFEAEAASNVALGLEMMGQGSDLTGATEAVARLKSEVETILIALSGRHGAQST